VARAILYDGKGTFASASFFSVASDMMMVELVLCSILPASAVALNELFPFFRPGGGGDRNQRNLE
jgi:hypothetical protein